VNRAVHVEHPDGWCRDGAVAARGTAFVDGARHDAEALATLFTGVNDRASFRATVESLSGFFAVVRVLDGTVLAATDHVRSVPLFYAPDLGVVSDSARHLRRRLGTRPVDTVAEAEYLAATYVTGGETLYPDVRTLRAGEVLALETTGGDRTNDRGGGDEGTDRTGGAVDDPRWESERYWTYAPSATAADPDRTPTDRLAAFDDALVGAFERLLAVADGRPVAVPLSGGVDSRLVATMLVRLGAEDVRAFTYGRPGTPDVRVAERVADELDLPWRHVPYDAERWRERFASPDRTAYYERADGFDAVPNLSAWPAVSDLLAEGWLPDDAVVVPGQTVAEIAGHLPAALLDDDATAGDAVASVLDRHYRQWAYDDRLERAFAARVRRVVDGRCDPADPTSVYAAWEWQERQAKFLCGDGRIYEHVGLDWWFPLWDPAVARAWGAFPASARLDKRRYDAFVAALYADVADVDRRAAERTQLDEDRLAAGLRRVRGAVAASPLADLVRPVYRRFRVRTASRESGPFAQFGVVPPEQFERLYEAGRTHHGFRALVAVGRLSFDPAREGGWPDEPLSVAGLERTRPAPGDRPGVAGAGGAGAGAGETRTDGDEDGERGGTPRAVGDD
jgi:asparagine synthase (glutamine-hydrolysing)